MLACGRAMGAAGMLGRLGTGAGLGGGGVGREGVELCEGGGALRRSNSSLAALDDAVDVAAHAIPEASKAPTASSAGLLSIDLIFRMSMFPSVSRK
jgi:hypothetical protein